VIQYCDTEDSKVLDELTEWLQNMSEIQRVVMVQNVMNLPNNFPQDGEVRKPLLQLIETIKPFAAPPLPDWKASMQEKMEKTENLDDVKDEIMSLLSDIDNKEVEETKKEEQPKTIYGGANPSANIKLDNEFKEKLPYEEKTIDLEKTEDLINTLNKETVKNEEDIEIL
jgi:hypothetical protein